MDGECSSINLIHSPRVVPGFQVDKFTKKCNQLNIPDTIQEQSGELSSNSTKMEAGSYISNNSSDNLQCSKSDESSNASTILPFDNSFLVDFEKKLLECSNPDDEKSYMSSQINAEYNHFRTISRKLGFDNDTISTPPNELRQQINILRDEMAESHEFHDLEIQILKEKLDECSVDNYLEVIEKYSTLMKLYTSLQKEYEDYRKEQDQVKNELHYKTASCLENLCSQIEASDSSLNFSNASFTSFNEIRNSTMVGISQLNVGKEELNRNDEFFEELKYIKTENTELKNIFNILRDRRADLKDDILKSYGNMHEVNDIDLKPISEKIYCSAESGLFFSIIIDTITDCCKTLRQELFTKFDVNKAEWENQKEAYRELIDDLQNRIGALNKESDTKTSELERTKEKYQALEEHLVKAVPVNSDKDDKIRNLQNLNESLDKTILAAEENIEKLDYQLSAAERNRFDSENIRNGLTDKMKFLTSEIKANDLIINQLQNSLFDINSKHLLDQNNSHFATEQVKNDLLMSKEIILKLQSQLLIVENEKNEIECKCQELERATENLKSEIATKEVLILDLENSLEEIKSDKENLQKIIQTHESHNETIKEDLLTAEDNIGTLRLHITNLEARRKEIENKCQQLEEASISLNAENNDKETLLKNLELSIKEIKIENETLQGLLKKTEEISMRYKGEVEAAEKTIADYHIGSEKLLQKIELLTTENHDFKKLFDALRERKDLIVDAYSNFNDWNGLDGSNLCAKLTHQGFHFENPTYVSVVWEIMEECCRSVQETLIEKYELTKSNEVPNRNIESELLAAEETIRKLHSELANSEIQKKEVESKYEELEDTVVMLNAENAMKETILKVLEKTIDEGKLNNETNQRLLKESEHTLETYNKELERAKSAFVEEQNKNEKLLQEIEFCHDKIDRYKALLTVLQDNKETIIETYSNISSDLCTIDLNLSLNNESNDSPCAALLSVMCETIKNCCESFKEAVNTKFELERVEFENEKKADVTTIENLQDQIHCLNDKIKAQERLLEDLENFKNLCDILKEKVAKAEIVISEMEETIRNQEESKQQMESELRSVEGTLFELSKFKIENEDLKKKCEMLSDVVKEKEGILNDIENVLEVKMDHGNVKELINAINSSEARIKKIQSDLTADQEIIVKLQSELLNSENEKSEVTARYQKLEEISETLKSEMIAKEILITHMENSLEELKLNTENLKESNESYRGHILGAEKTIETLRSELENLEAKRQELETQLATSNAEVLQEENNSKELEKALEEIKLENKNLLKLKNQLEKELELSKSTITHNQNCKEILKKELEKLTKENDDLKKVFDVLLESKKIFIESYSDLSNMNEQPEIELSGIFCDGTDPSINERFLPIVYDTIKDCCKSFKEALNSKYMIEKEQWNTLYKIDELSLQNFENQIEILKGRMNVLENLSEELNESRNLCESLKERIAQTESVMSKKDNDFHSLEMDNEKINLELSRAKEATSKLQSLLTVSEKEKKEMENEFERRSELLNDLESRLEAKETLIKELEDSLEKLKEDNRNLQELINSLEHSEALSREIQNDLLTANESITKLQSEIITAQNDKIEIESKCLELENIIETLKSEILEIMLKNLADSLEEMKADRENIEKLIESNEFQYSHVEEELTTAKEAINKLSSELTTLNARKEEIEDKYQRLEGTVATLNADISEKEKMLRCLEKSLKEVKFDNETLQGLLKESKDELKNCKSELEAAKCAVTEKEINNEKLLREVDLLTEENGDLKKVFDVLRVCKEAFSDAFTGIPKDLSSIDLNFAEYNSELTSRCAPYLSVVCDTVRACCKSLREGLIKEFESKEEEWENLKKVDLSLIENLQDEIRNLGLKVQAHEAVSQELENLKEVCDALKDKITEAEIVISEKENEIQSQINLNNKLQSDLAHVEGTVVELKSLLSASEIEKRDMESKCEKLADAIDALEAEINAKEAILKELEKSLSCFEEVKFDNENLKKIIKESEEVVDDLKGELSVAKKELSRNEDLREELKVLKNENDELKNIFDVLRDNKQTLGDLYSKASSNMSDINLINVKLISEKIKTSAKYSITDSVNTAYLSIVSDTIVDCCKSVQQKLIEEIDRGKSELESLEKLKLQVETLKSENSSKEVRVTELLEEVEILQREKLDSSVLSNKVKALEKNKKNLTDILSDVQCCLDLSDNTIGKLLSGNFENRKIITEGINSLVKSQMDGLKIENANLKLGNDILKGKVNDLSKLIDEFTNQQMKEENPGNPSYNKSMKSSLGRNVDLCTRRLDKLEEINHNLTELMTRILTMTDFPNLDKLKFMSVRDYPNISKKVVRHFEQLELKMKDLETANTKLDEECDSYAKTIKDLKKEAVVVWKSNKEKTESLEAEIQKIKNEKAALEADKEKSMARISKLETDCEKLRESSKQEAGPVSSSLTNANELKKIHDLKRAILIKEQKILELQDLENQNSLHKSQIKYLENALEQEKKRIRQEKEKNKKLQNEISELSQKQKVEKKVADDNEMLEELRMGGSVSGGVVQEFVDKEKIRKLAKDIGILKELCRARYAEIKRLEAENAALRSTASKNSNQMDSPLCVRTYNTRSKNLVKDRWKGEVKGKENIVV